MLLVLLLKGQTEKVCEREINRGIEKTNVRKGERGRDLKRGNKRMRER